MYKECLMMLRVCLNLKVFKEYSIISEWCALEAHILTKISILKQG